MGCAEAHDWGFPEPLDGPSLVPGERLAYAVDT